MLNYLLKKANIVAISLVFFTFGFVLGKDLFDLTLGEEITVIIASVACVIAILTSLYVSKMDGFRALDHVPEKACPGLDPGWAPVFRKGH